MPTASPHILLLTPPLTQLNTPYPATAYIKGFLTGRGYSVRQADLSIGLVLRLFSKEGLVRVFDEIEQGNYALSDNAQRMLRLRRRYEATIGPAIRFLQNRDLTLAPRICHGRFLPEASRFDNVADLETAFGTMGLTDQARHLATLYLEDLADLVKETVGPQFGLSRYAESLAMSATHFDPLHAALEAAPNLVDRMLLELLDEVLADVKPDFVGFTVPFPGNLYAALRLAQRIKQTNPAITTVMGGGYPNTELRGLKEPRFFDYIDYLTLDDGEGPWLRLLDYLQAKNARHAERNEASWPLQPTASNEAVEMLRSAQHDGRDEEANLSAGRALLQRTFLRNEAGQVEYINHPHPDVPHPEVGTPVRSIVQPHALDDVGAICAAMIKTQRADAKADLRPMIDPFMTYIMTKEFRLADGTLARNRPQPNTLWLDDLFMSIPALAQMGKLTGERRYYDEAVAQLAHFAPRMFDKQKGLYMHGWVQGMAEHPEFHWARANGWAILTKVELLDVLPADHPGRPAVLELLRAHARGLADRQAGSGFWHQLLDRNDSYLETSATAIYCYAIAHAINQGWLDARVYGPMTLLAWNAVSTKVNAQGQVEGTCVGTGMGFDPAFYYYRPVNVYAAHGYGPVLLAGAEIIQLLKQHPFGINDSSMQTLK